MPTTPTAGRTLALLALAQLIVSLDYNIVYVALPDIGASLGFSAPHLQWVVSAYAVAFGGFLLLGGRACDLLGRRRTFRTGLTAYALSSALGALADQQGALLAARAAQGLGGALLFPATLALVATGFAEGRERNRAMSVWAATGASGLVVGSLTGGLLTQLLGWQAVFWVNVPLAGTAVLLAGRLLPADGPRRTDRAFDLPGALTGTSGTTLLVLALSQSADPNGSLTPVLLLAAVGTALLAAFALRQRRARDPLLPPRLLRHPALAAGTATAFLFMAGFGSLFYFLTVYFQHVRHYDALRTGLAFLAPMACCFAGSVLGGRLTTRYGTRTTLLGALLLGGLGVAATAAAVSPTGGYPALLPGLVAFGLGQGVVFTVMFAASSTGIAPQDQGVAAGIVSTGQQVGGAVGLAVLVALARTAPGADTAAVTAGLRTALFAVVAGVALMLLVARAFDRPARTTPGLA
ncbi:MFS transporter [Kitasatospora phosalacinea]|uniref:MFS transporter n=1 Tax=Kitasatospora phosalacinea TaxID=2065 RepID=UPI0035E206B4